MGQRHQKRAIEKIDSQKKMNRRRKSFETNDVPSEVFGRSYTVCNFLSNI